MRKFATLFTLFILTTSLFSYTQAQTYEELASRAFDYIDSKDYIAAEQVLISALKKEPANPGNALLLTNLGTIQRELKKYDEALISYSAVLAKHPSATAILHNRAALYCEIDSLDRALIDYNSILNANDKDTEAMYRRGLIFLDKKDYTAAVDDFERIKKINDKDLRAQQGLALVLKRKGEWTKAEELYTNLIFDNRNNAELYIDRAECYLELGKLARTQEDLNKGISLGANYPFVYIISGRLKLAQYDKFSAKEYFLKALDLGADETLVNELLLHCK